MITLERFIAGSDLVHRRDPGPTTSPTEEAAITQRIRNANPSFFWPTLLLPAPRRNAIQALYFFSRELRGIADGNALPTLKLAQLADWRAQIELLYAGRPQHFVTRALSDAVDRFDLRCVDFLAIIDGMESEARTNIRAPSLEQLYLYCKQRSVVVMRIALRILGAAQADADQVAAALGRGMVLTGILRDLTRDARRHRLYLPRELLQAHGIFATMPSYVLAQPALYWRNRRCHKSATRLPSGRRIGLRMPRTPSKADRGGGWEQRQQSSSAITGCSGHCSSAAGNASTSRFAFQPGADQRSPSDTVSSLANAAMAAHHLRAATRDVTVRQRHWGDHHLKFSTQE
jgi:hypothetical protein